MSLINMASRAAPVFSRALIGLAIAAAAGVGLSQTLAAEPNLGPGSVFTANEEGGSLSRIDLKSGKVQSVTLPLMPHNVDISAEAGLVFVVGAGQESEMSMSGQAPGSKMKMAMAGSTSEPGGRLAVLKLDAIDKGPIAVVDIGHHLAHVIPDRDGKRVFVTDSESNTVSVIDLSTLKVSKTIPTGRYPHGLRLSPDGKELFVANVEDGSVSVIDVASLAESARIPVGKAPVQVGFTPDGTRVYVSLRDEDSVAVIDRATRQVVAKVTVGRNPIQVYATPDGQFVYVADQGSDANPDDRVSIIDVAGNKVVKTLNVGAGAHGVTITKDGRYAYITNIKDDSVSVIDTAAQAVVRTIPVGKGPNGITVFSGNS
jgi:YVTN family beta-propeller protein